MPPGGRRAPRRAAHAGRRGPFVPAASTLDLGGRRYDLTHRALVMGILNRTPDSFYDKGATFELDTLYARAEQLVADGADILDVGGVKAGPGPEVTEAEELDRVVRSSPACVERFDTPVSVDTWRASVARASLRRGRGDGQRHQRPGRPRLRAGGGRARGRRRRHPHPPRPPGGRPRAALRRRRRRRGARSSPSGPPAPVPPASRPSASCSTPASTSARRPSSRSALLRASQRLAGLGYPLLLSASNKTFLGKVLDLEITERGAASIGAAALGISWGCRIVRVHDVMGTCRARDALAAVSEAAVSAPRRYRVDYLVQATTPRWSPRRCARSWPRSSATGTTHSSSRRSAAARATSSTSAPSSTPA